MATTMRRGRGYSALSGAERDALTASPVPQADDLEKVFEVVRLVDEGYTTAAEVAEQLEVVPRQGLYYVTAALSLRLIDAIDRGEDGVVYETTGAGRSLLRDPESKRARRRAVTTAPIVRFVAAELGTDARYPLADVLLDTGKVARALTKLGLSDVTAERRAYTVKAWLKALS